MHNKTKVDFGSKAKVIYTGVKTGKSSFLENESDEKYDEYYGSSYINRDVWKVMEQDGLILDDQSKCICRYIKSTADCFKESNRRSPLIILAATNLDCWLASFKEVHIYPQKFYTIKEWYKMLDEHTSE